ncbi:MAG: hypothetical protein KDA24_04030 [Deltaproteobacteria bacterium]|nr:hypothetical protein [Deltaproteobacteria bacterium]
MSAVAPRDVDVRNIQMAPGNDPNSQRAPYPSMLRVCVRHAGKDRRRSAIDVSRCLVGSSTRRGGSLGPR